MSGSTPNRIQPKISQPTLGQELSGVAVASMELETAVCELYRHLADIDLAEADLFPTSNLLQKEVETAMAIGSCCLQSRPE